MSRDAECALASARRVIAEAVLGPQTTVAASLGDVTLRHHQQLAVGQLQRLIQLHGGAMLADRVGTGKTYVALSVARGFATTLVIAPASLRSMWAAATSRAQVPTSFISYESLSRGQSPVSLAELVIFDEAHRLRNNGTRRYAMAARLSQHAKVLLLSATPVQNRASDLATQLALFLGRAALFADRDALAKYVVRGDEPESGVLPRLEGPCELIPADDEAVVEDLVSLPPAVAAADEGTAAALLTMGLLHQWTSSQAALVAALKRRRSRGLALIAALEGGRYPSRSELSSWSGSDGALQLAFPEVASANIPRDVDGHELSERVRRHLDAVYRLLERLRGNANTDIARANLLRQIRARHPSERIIAFTQYAETVAGLFRLLVRDGRVAALSARGARVASGHVSRDDILSQFVPGQSTVVASSMVVDLLLATDVLSEGLNLQEASVVVHLDLPWNPARMEQRVGRVRRLGSKHRRIVVYLIQPSRAAERLLAIESRLRGKLRAAERTVGVAGRILPASERDPEHEAPGAAESIGRLRVMLRGWRMGLASDAPVPAFAAVRGKRPGFLAAVRCRDGCRLLARMGGVVQTDVDALLRAARFASGAAVACNEDQLQWAKEMVYQWIERERARDSLDLRPIVTVQNRRRALARLARILARTPRHQRPAVIPLIAAARTVVTEALSEGRERELDQLVTSDVPDEAWLQSLAGLSQPHLERLSATTEPILPELVAMIVFQKEPHARGRANHANKETMRADEEAS